MACGKGAEEHMKVQQTHPSLGMNIQPANESSTQHASPSFTASLGRLLCRPLGRPYAVEVVVLERLGKLSG